MRKFVAVGSVVLSSLVLILPGAAQQTSTPGQFAGGFMPGNIVNKPVNVGTAVAPLNLNQAMMPRQQSSKVFNLMNVFHKPNLQPHRSTATTAPIQPGKITTTLPPLPTATTTSRPY